MLQEATCMVQTRMDVAKGYGTRQAAAQGQNEGLGAVWLQVGCVGCACMPQLDGGPGAGTLLSPHSSWRLSEALACNSSRYGCSAASTKFSRAPVSWLQQGTKLVRGVFASWSQEGQRPGIRHAQGATQAGKASRLPALAAGGIQDHGGLPSSSAGSGGCWPGHHTEPWQTTVQPVSGSPCSHGGALACPIHTSGLTG